MKFRKEDFGRILLLLLYRDLKYYNRSRISPSQSSSSPSFSQSFLWDLESNQKGCCIIKTPLFRKKRKNLARLKSWNKLGLKVPGSTYILSKALFWTPWDVVLRSNIARKILGASFASKKHLESSDRVWARPLLARGFRDLGPIQLYLLLKQKRPQNFLKKPKWWKGVESCKTKQMNSCH